eukprot:scaffold4189_cov378-Prasinococcus_capsulatus_cf.AAC.13
MRGRHSCHTHILMNVCGTAHAVEATVRRGPCSRGLGRWLSRRVMQASPEDVAGPCDSGAAAEVTMR